jgi:hypothetical protein
MNSYIPESGKLLLTYDMYTGQFEYVRPDMVSANPNKPDARQIAVARLSAIVASYYTYNYLATREPFKSRGKFSRFISALLVARGAYYFGQHLTPKQTCVVGNPSL